MEEIVKVTNLKKYFESVKAVDDVSFAVERGEMFGFLGVNGAGKSTTIHMLCTLLTPTDGAIEIAGFRVGRQNEEIKRHIGVVYQENVLDKLLTVKENLICRGSLYEKSRRLLKERLWNVCDIFSLSDVINRPYGKLSGGQKRRCEIAAALMHTPDLLFLDEPTTGLDPATRKSVWQTLDTLRREMNMTIFLTTHYMEEAANANHIGIMDSGHLVQYGTPFSLKEQFAKDRLILNCTAGQRAELEQMLGMLGLSYTMREERLIVTVSNTMAVIPILEQIADKITGFEVIQATMDDVFLNVTQMLA